MIPKIEKVWADMKTMLGVNGLARRRDFLSWPALRSVLDTECARTDRTGEVFCLVTFELEALNKLNVPLENFLPVLFGRVRSVDVCGRMESKTLGLVLPGTPIDGAWRLADDICRRISVSSAASICMVYAYPWQETVFPQAGASKNHPLAMPPGSNDSAFPSDSETQNSNPRLRFRCDTAAGQRDAKRLVPPRAQGMTLWKRAVDIVGALCGITLLAPVMGFVALLIKRVSPGPVIFKQQRVGRLGRLFTFYKFRTMHVNADISVHQKHLKTLIHSDDPITKLDTHNDLRIIPFGDFLRRSCLDELPQLLNVLRGEMSLVGPRPCLSYEATEFQPWHTRRFDALPGMTGLWQVKRNNRMTFQGMIRLDVTYAQTASFAQDVKILFLTFVIIFDQFKRTLIAGRVQEEVPSQVLEHGRSPD